MGQAFNAVAPDRQHALRPRFDAKFDKGESA
jgi:hypothetical protein